MNDERIFLLDFTKLREAHDMTQEELAEEYGLSVDWVRKMERGPIHVYAKKATAGNSDLKNIMLGEFYHEIV